MGGFAWELDGTAHGCRWVRVPGVAVEPVTLPGERLVVTKMAQ